MACTGCFPGVVDQVRRCSTVYYWLIYLEVKDRFLTSNAGGITFQVDVDGAPLSIKADDNEQCFTLLFDDNGADHTVTVTHAASGFTATGHKPGTGNQVSTLILSKPWILEVLVQEKWPGDQELAFARAKLVIAGEPAAADGDGKHRKADLALDSETAIKLDVNGLETSRCTVTVETVPPKTEDGFLKEARTLKQTDKANEITLDVGHAGATVKVKFVVEVTVLKPKIDPEDVLVLWFYDDTKGHQTLLSEVLAKLEGTPPLKSPLGKDIADDLKATLTFDAAKAECFKDAKGTDAFTSATAIAWKDPFKLHLKGKGAGEDKLTLKLSTARAATDRSWRIKGDPSWPDESGEAESKVWVEKLEIDAFTFLEGKSIADVSYATTKVTTTPKKRELHNKNLKIFTAARLTVKKPTEGFWERAQSVTLSTEGTLSVWKEAGCTTALKELKKEAFNKDPIEIWVEATGAAGLDLETVVPWSKWKKLPEKPMKPGYVLLGAKTKPELGAREFLRGSVMALDTYAFDVHLDRKTRNDCGVRVIDSYDTEDYDDVTLKDVAVACAGGHKYYDLLSAFHVNRNYLSDGVRSPFGGFIASMRTRNGTNESWSTDGADFVAKHLQDNHAIALCGTMKAMIKAYIKRVLDGWDGEAANFGFDLTRGVPGVHAEVLAVNEILSRGVPVAEVTVATYRLQDSLGGQGLRFVACTNCRGILLEGAARVRVITG